MNEILQKVLRFGFSFFLIVVALAAIGCSNGDDDDDNAGDEIVPDQTVQQNGLFWVDGNIIRDKQGRAIILRGINVSNLYKYEPTVRTEPDYIGAEGYRNIADSGFNAVRLLTQWYAIEPEEGAYDQDYIDLMTQRIEWATAAGLYVLIDMHQDVFGVGFGDNGAPRWACDESNYESFEPATPWFTNYLSEEVQACYSNFWESPELQHSLHLAAAAVGETVADNPLVIGFDTYNEPGWIVDSKQRFEGEALWPFNIAFAETLESYVPERLYFFEPAIMLNLINIEFPDAVTQFAGVYAPHYYNTSAKEPDGGGYDGNGDAVRAVMSAAGDEAERLNVPLVLGEMGGNAETPDLDRYFDDLYGALDSLGAGAFLYDYTRTGEGNGYLLRDTLDWHPVARAFLRPTPSAIAGDPVSFGWDYGTLTFNLSWDEDPQAGDTEIILPEWVDTVGFSLRIDDTEATPVYNDLGNRLVVAGGVGGSRTVQLIAAAGYPEPTTASR